MGSLTVDKCEVRVVTHGRVSKLMLDVWIYSGAFLVEYNYFIACSTDLNLNAALSCDHANVPGEGHAWYARHAASFTVKQNAVQFPLLPGAVEKLEQELIRRGLNPIDALLEVLDFYEALHELAPAYFDLAVRMGETGWRSTLDLIEDFSGELASLNRQAATLMEVRAHA